MEELKEPVSGDNWWADIRVPPVTAYRVILENNLLKQRTAVSSVGLVS